MGLLAAAYRKSHWFAHTTLSDERPSLQHLGQLLEGSPAGRAGGRFLRYTGVDTKGLSEGDKVIVPTFNAAELIQSPKMYGLPFDFCSHGTHFGIESDYTNMAFIELINPDKPEIALPYGVEDDAGNAYAPHLIHPWVYLVDKVSIVGSGFPEARNSTSFVETAHNHMRFIRLRAVAQSKLHVMIKTNEAARSLYTGRRLPLQELFGVYRHLYHYRTTENMPPKGR